jgi:Fe-S oxidoreductase
VTVFPTCLVEFQDVQIGQDLVKVYERNGIECAVTRAGCCGAPWLHSGNVAAFAEVAERNVAVLAAEIRAGTDVVVPQPSCSYVIRHDYLDHVGGADATLVAEHTHDAASYLLEVHTGEHTSIDTDFAGETFDTITYHAPCQRRAQSDGLDSRDLMKLTGARVHVVRQCAGVDGLWSCRATHDDAAVPIAEQLGARIAAAGDDLVAGDCSLANAVIAEQTGRSVSHPLQVLARAYGIAQE